MGPWDPLGNRGTGAISEIQDPRSEVRCVCAGEALADGIAVCGYSG